MHSAGTCDSPREDLASLGDVLLQSLSILIIDLLVLVCAELAYFSSSHASIRTSRSVVHHDSCFPLSLEWNVILGCLECIREIIKAVEKSAALR